MRKRITAALLCLMLSAGCIGAAEASAYQELCEQRGLRSAEVIAWLEIPGASICEPVMRHPEDDEYYAAHDAEGNESMNGALYVQGQYNADDFSDPVTLIYGGSSSETAPFGMLQELYSGSFDQCRTLQVHLPQKTSQYMVFAALPYSAIHILHYYDFSIARRFDSFFDGVFSTRALGMHLDKENRPAVGKDRVVVLSTGLRGDPLQRYLVMAREMIP